MPSKDTKVVPAKSGGGGPFHRRGPDKRLVREVVTILHQPTHWTHMDIQEHDCKLMEVRKYSAEYFDLDSKFRRPDFELISAYAVQNPFLWGQHQLRREHISMQLSKGRKAAAKDKLVYFPLQSFSDIEAVARHGFVGNAAAANGFVRFYATSEAANEQIRGDSNPRVMLVVRLVVGLAHTLEDGEVSNDGLVLYQNSTKATKDGLLVDTLVTSDKSVLLKSNLAEAYPEHVLVFRTKSGQEDSRTPRIKDVVLHCQIAYRSGTRYNPDEAKPPAVQLLAKTAAALTATPSVPPTAVVAARKKSAPGRKDSQRVSEGDEDIEASLSMSPGRASGLGAVPKRAHATTTTTKAETHAEKASDEHEIKPLLEKKAPLATF